MTDALRKAELARNAVLDEARRLAAENTELRVSRFRHFNNEDCWIYLGDGSDHLESLVCPVVIQPHILLALLERASGITTALEGASKPPAQPAEAEPAPLIDIEMRLWNIYDCRSRNDAHEKVHALIADLTPPPAQPAEAEPKLDKPASVGNAVFGVGVSVRLLIDAAQRRYEYLQDPEQVEARQTRLGEFQRLLGEVHGAAAKAERCQYPNCACVGGTVSTCAHPSPDTEQPQPEIPVGCEMANHWAVSVEVAGQNILTISHQHLAGVPDIGPWESTIRGCAKHLLSFIGATPDTEQQRRDAVDALRYRQLRAYDWFDGPLCVVRDPKQVFSRGSALGADCPSRERLDQAIDAAIEAEGRQ